MIEANNLRDASLYILRPCDSELGFNSVSPVTLLERKCTHCGHPYLREVFVSGDNMRTRYRVQCPQCLSRTLNVYVDFQDALRHFKRGWFWYVDDEGYPVFGNGKRVDPSYL